MTQQDCERRGLIDAVLASPEDDAPRLIYADWLSDHGEDDRAKFIRLQIAIARRDPAYLFDESMNWTVHERSAIPEARQAAERLRAIAREGRRARGWNGSLDVSAVWRRGFIESVLAWSSDWRRIGPAIVREHPLRTVQLLNWKPEEIGASWRVRRFPPHNWYTSSLPEEWFDLLPDSEGGDVITYADRDELVGDVSDALILWARTQPVDSAVDSAAQLAE